MKRIPAGEVNLPAESPIWHLLEKTRHPSIFKVDGVDLIPVDVQWVRESADGGDEDVKVLALALDAVPECSGWRGVKLLYFWPH